MLRPESVVCQKIWMGETTVIERDVGYAWLSGDFIRGYTKAIQDIKEVFAYVNADIAPRKV